MKKFTFLPQLDDRHPAPSASDWSSHTGGAQVLEKFAESLLFEGADTPAARLKSVPSPWARPLLFAHALASDGHPAHAQVVEEWRGLWGFIALQDYLGHKATARPLVLQHADNPSADADVVAALARLAPAPIWHETGLIWSDESVAGGISPLSLVFTGIRDFPLDVPFVENHRVTDPARYYRDAQDDVALGLLVAWIAHVLDALRGARPRLAEYTPDPGFIIELFEAWHADAVGWYDGLTSHSVGKPADLVERFESAGLAPHGDAHATGILAVFDKAICRVDTPSNDLAFGDLTIDPGDTGVILRDGRPFSGTIRLPKGQSQSVENGRLTNPLPSGLIAPSCAPERHLHASLTRVVGARKDGGALATDENMKEAFYHPVASVLLETIGPRTLQDSLSVHSTGAGGFEVTLELSLVSGFAVRFVRKYEERSVEKPVTPALAIWPDFVAGDWSDHFYFVDALELESPISVRPSTDAVSVLSDDGRFSWGRTDRPITAWVASDSRNELGLLLPRVPAQLEPADAGWDVSVDFGSTNTRVFHRAHDVADNAVVAPVSFMSRTRVLMGEAGFEAESTGSFFPGGSDENAAVEELQSLIRFPTRPIPDTELWLPTRGLIYFGAVEPNSLPANLRSHLKWHESGSEDQRAFASYLSQLLLMIRAEARAGSATVDRLGVAHPAAFPQNMFMKHRQAWSDIVGDDLLMDPMTESTSLANYLKYSDSEVQPDVNLAAVDIGGSTSDLSIWAHGSPVRTESVRFAGEFLSTLVARDDELRKAIADVSESLGLRAASSWKEAEPDAIQLAYNAVLREATRKRGSASSIATSLYDSDAGPGGRLIFHVGYFFAALAYLMGLLSRQADGQPHSTYYLHFGGWGSDYYRWLDTLAGDFGKDIVEAFFSAGLGAECRVLISTSDSAAKHEVGTGLLSRAFPDVGAPGERQTVVGETGLMSPHETLVDPFTTITPTSFSSTVAHPDGPVALDQLTFLTDFIAAFDSNEATRRLGKALGVGDSVRSDALRDAIYSAVFGRGSAWERGTDTAVFEPIIVTELKVLLEHATGRANLFSR